MTLNALYLARYILGKSVSFRTVYFWHGLPVSTSFPFGKKILSLNLLLSTVLPFTFYKYIEGCFTELLILFVEMRRFVTIAFSNVERLVRKS